MTKDEKTHALAVKRFTRVENKEREQRRLAIEDIRFAQTEDGQWDDNEVADYEHERR